MGKTISGKEATCLISRTWLTARFICILARARRAVPIIGCTSTYNSCLSCSAGDTPITASLNAGSAEKNKRKQKKRSHYRYCVKKKKRERESREKEEEKRKNYDESKNNATTMIFYFLTCNLFLINDF